MVEVFIEAHKIDAGDEDHPITMEWIESVDQVKNDVSNLEETELAEKIKEFKATHGAGYQYYKHIHPQGGSCELVEI